MFYISYCSFEKYYGDAIRAICFILIHCQYDLLNVIGGDIEVIVGIVDITAVIATIMISVNTRKAFSKKIGTFFHICRDFVLITD